MATVDWVNKIITIPRADLTDKTGGLFELNVNTLRLELKAAEETDAGMVFPTTHNHNTEVNIGGITYARLVEIINGYTITFEDGQYSVTLVGANNNIADVLNVNQVSVRSNNSAGLQIVATDGSVNTGDIETKLDLLLERECLTKRDYIALQK